MVFVAMGRSDRAIADLEDVTREAPTGARYFHLARAYELANNPRQAQRAFQQARAVFGLKAEHLHPAEQLAFRRLSGEQEPR